MKNISLSILLFAISFVCIAALHASQQHIKKQKMLQTIEYGADTVTIHLDRPLQQLQLLLEKDDLYTTMQKRLKSAITCCILSPEDDAGKVQNILKYGIEKKSRNKLLRLAAIQGKKNIASMLLYRGADIKARNEYTAATILHSAILAQYSCGMGIINLLLQHGACVRSKDRFQKNSLELALHMAREEQDKVYQQHARQVAVQLCLHQPRLPLKVLADWELISDILLEWVYGVMQTIVHTCSDEALEELHDCSEIEIAIMRYLFDMPEFLYYKNS